MKYQTDFDNKLQINKSGCYVCQIATEIENHVGRDLFNVAFEEIVHIANKKHFLAYDYNDFSKPGCFIMNDEGFGNLILDALSSSKRLHSLGRIYTQEGVEHYQKQGQMVKNSLALRDIAEDANIIILQIQTTNGGHFRGLDHDPYKPGTQIKYVKSFRYFRIK